MKNIILRAVNRALAVVLVLSILATGGLSVYLTHVHASVTITFGTPAVDENKVVLADAIDVSQLRPLPLRRGK